MNWERIESARMTARFMLAIPWVAIALLGFAEVSAPAGPTPMFDHRVRVLGLPISELLVAVGVVGLVVGFVWMWKLYRAPTKYEGAHWRFHDH